MQGQTTDAAPIRRLTQTASADVRALRQTVPSPAIVWRRRAEREGSSHEPDEAASYGRHALAALSLVAFFWLTTLDVYVAEGRNTDGVPAFCGSAYDVALLKGDGFMGGEVPPNQAAIDRACLAAAPRDVVLAGTAGVTGLAAAAYVVLLPRRTRVPAGQP